MKKIFFTLTSCFALLQIIMGQSATDLKLWYNQPAKLWNEALPLGNGRIAAMVFGSPNQEKLQLNESSVWAGGPSRNDNPNALSAIPQIQAYIFAGQYAAANNLVSQKVIATQLQGAPYQTIGNLLLNFPGHENYSHYYRELDIERAVFACQYLVNGVQYKREVIASLTDQVIAIRLTANETGKITFNTSFSGPLVKSIATEGSDKLIIKGTSGNYGPIVGQVNFDTHVKIVNKGGTVSAAGDSISVSGADAATIYISIATNFVDYLTLTDDPELKAENYLTGALTKDFDALKTSHISAYQNYFNRVSFDLGKTDAVNLPINSRVRNFSTGNDPQLVCLYFQFARYLLISSSQPGGQPANLQGIWNDKTSPPWGSKYTININTEMNYWPAEVTNLTEMHEPLIQMVRELSVAGKQTAQTMYGANGWVTHHNTDIWRMCGAIDGAYYGMWPMGGAWLSQHLWEKYLFSGDVTYLDSVYPILKGACEFYISTMVHEPVHNWLVVCPSMSPENSPSVHPDYSIAAGTTIDNQLIFDLFTKTMDAAKILDIDSAFCSSLQETLDQMLPMQIGKYSQLQEWMEDWDSPSDKNRHVSHLYGAFPSNQISPVHTPELMDAARTSLIYRGDESTGWSMGWKVNLWARFLDGNHAYKLITDQLTLIDPAMESGSGGTYPNLFDAHPPFQIDGNFGCASGIAEMLLQSQDGDLHVLPALPDNWQSGSFTGLRARGGFEVGAEWEEGKVQRLTIKSTIGGNCRIRVSNYIALENGANLIKAVGNNSNPFYKVPQAKTPIISVYAHLNPVIVSDTMVYDLLTDPGHTYTIIAVSAPAFQSAKIEGNAKQIQVKFSDQIAKQSSYIGFAVSVNNIDSVNIDSISYDSIKQILLINLANEINKDDTVSISYSGGNVLSTHGFNLVTFSDMPVDNLLPGSRSRIVSARTTFDGLKVGLKFNKKMSNPVDASAGFVITNESLAGMETEVNDIFFDGSDSAMLVLSLAEQQFGDYVLSLAYSGDNVFSFDSGALASFNGLPIENLAIGLPPEIINSEIIPGGLIIILESNKPISNSIGQLNAFSLTINGDEIPLEDVSCNETEIQLESAATIRAGDTVKVSYTGDLLESSDGGKLAAFTDLLVNNTIPVTPFYAIPGKIEAENSVNSFGTQTESTSDKGGGLNASWIDNNDWLEYSVDVKEARNYIAYYRVASPGGGGKMSILTEEGIYIDTINIPKTNGWQNWVTVKSTLNLDAGRQYFKIFVISGGFNINWILYEPNLLPFAAYDPTPVNSSIATDTTLTLTWKSGKYAKSHKVFLGTDETLDQSTFKGKQSDSSFLISNMSLNTTYYWRIDEVDSAGTTKGPVWNFTTKSLTGFENVQNDIQSVRVYPNPVTDGKIIIEWHQSKESEVTFSIMDLQGRILIQKNIEDKQKAQMSVGDLREGVYILFIRTNNVLFIQRLIVE